MYKPCRSSNGRAHYECVLVDINTQRDFADPVGSTPVANADVLGPALRRVIAWAKWNSAPVVSSMESHREMELSDSGTPISCLDGSGGQEKLPFTLLDSRIRVEFDNTVCIKTDLFQQYQQVVFRKRGEDLMENPKADHFLTQLPVREYILFGAGLETAIKSVALGLLARAKKVSILADACGHWHSGTADLALRQLIAKGAVVITVDDLLKRQLQRRQLRYRVRTRYNGNGRLHVTRPHLGSRRDNHEPTIDKHQTPPPTERTHRPLPTEPIKDRMPRSEGRTGRVDE